MKVWISKKEVSRYNNVSTDSVLHTDCQIGKWLQFSQNKCEVWLTYSSRMSDVRKKKKKKKKIWEIIMKVYCSFVWKIRYLYKSKIFSKKKNEVGTIKLWSTTAVAPAKWIWIYFFLVSKFNFSVEKVSLTFQCYTRFPNPN